MKLTIDHTVKYAPYLYAAASCLIGLYVCDFSIGFGSMTFGHLADAAHWSNGFNLEKTTAYFPIGYPLLLSFISLFGLSPFSAGLVLNLLSHFGIVVILTRTKIVAPIWIKRLFFACIILSPMPLAHMTFVWVEAPFTLFCLIAFEQINQMVTRQKEQQKSTLLQLSLLAAACSMPIYMRYIGVFVPIAGVIVILLFAFKYRGLAVTVENLGEYMFASLLLLTFITPQIFKNYLIHSDVFGHPVDAAPAYDFVTAMKVTLLHVGDFLFGNMALYQLSQLESYKLMIASFGTAIPIIASILILLRAWTFKMSTIAVVFILTYVILFSIAQSTTRLDLIVYRFVHPLWPFVILIIMGIWEHDDHCRKRQLINIYQYALKVLAISTLLVLLALGVYRGTHQLKDISNFNYSPNLLEHIRKNLKQDSVVLVNRFGDQIRAIRPDLEVHMIPFLDPNNGNYQQVYGVVHWDENQFRRLAQKLGFNQIIMFMGASNTDPFLNNGWYGDYMTSIINGSERTFTSRDGFIVQAK